jgi:hypothetical protein
MWDTRDSFESFIFSPVVMKATSPCRPNDENEDMDSYYRNNTNMTPVKVRCHYRHRKRYSCKYKHRYS